MAKIKKSARMKKRYLLIMGNRRDVDVAILEGVGELGRAKASPRFIKKDFGAGKVVLCVERKAVDNMRASFELSYRKGRKIKVLKVSGTLKGLEK
jgi:RNase P/RNase MRP subunit POP5